MEIDVFISYHTDSSKHIVESIVNKLENKGIRCWYAPRDAKGSYAGSIVKAIKQCKIFLLILNKEASESKHVLNEMEMATEQLGENIEDIIPFRISEEEISDDAKYYLNRIHCIDATTPTMEERVSELVEKVSTILGKTQIQKVAPYNLRDYHLSTMKIYADNDFKGREAELETIRQILQSDKNKYFIVGMGGSGKSELARKYCEIHEKDYENIVWITYNNSIRESVINDGNVNIQGVVRSEHLDKSEDEFFEYKLNVLKNITDEKTLLVVDNFDVSEDEHLSELCAGRYAIIFTTRYRDIDNRFTQMILDEMKLDAENQLVLFNRFYNTEVEDDDIETVKEILTLLDGHVLSIRIVASTMCKNSIDPSAMLNVLRNTGSGELSEVVYNRIKELMRLSQLTEKELYLLKNLSLVTLQGIKKRLFLDWCEVKEFDTIQGLIDKSWIIRDGKDTVHLHPIVSDLAFEELCKDLGECEVFLKNIVSKYEKTDKFTRLYKEWLLALINYICEKLKKGHPLYNELLFTKARILHNLSRHTQSLKLYEQLLPLFDAREKMIFIYRELSHLYCQIGFPQKSIALAKESLSKFFTTEVGNLPENEIYIYKGLVTRIAESSRNLGNYDYAIDLAEKALEICLKHLPTGHYSSVAWGQYHLARALYMRGAPEDMERSENVLLEAIANTEREDDEWTKSHCVQLLAQVKMKKGEFEQALKDTNNIYEYHVAYYGKCVINIAQNRIFLGNIYRAMGNEEEAIKCYNEAIEIFHKCGTFKLEENARGILSSGKIGYVS